LGDEGSVRGDGRLPLHDREDLDDVAAEITLSRLERRRQPRPASRVRQHTAPGQPSRLFLWTGRRKRSGGGLR